MKRILNKYLHLFCIGTLLILISYWFVSADFDLKQLLKAPKYTIATIVSDWHHKNNTGTGVDYEYMVNHKKYSNTVNVDVKKGDRYLLIFDSLRPKNNVLLNVYPIYESVDPPTEGWALTELPVRVDTIEIRNRVLGD